MEYFEVYYTVKVFIVDISHFCKQYNFRFNALGVLHIWIIFSLFWNAGNEADKLFQHWAHVMILKLNTTVMKQP